MPRVRIDDREVDAPPGSTLLAAARALGLDIPALCYHPQCAPNTSCMACVVKVKDPDRIVPSCATLAVDGMRVESQTDEIRQVRRAALELLLSDHAGECRAPCHYGCPVGLDIPQVIREITEGRLEGAIATVRDELPLAGVLERVCPGFCERACRRGALDEPASIRLLVRHIADHDLASRTPYRPVCRPASGQKVAIIGTGPAGLAAAHTLLHDGHACTLFERDDRPGGSLRRCPVDQLPPEILDAEIRLIEKLGGRFQLATTIGEKPPLDDLRREFDAVLIATGEADDSSTGSPRFAHSRVAHRFSGGGANRPATSSVSSAESPLKADPQTHGTDISGVFVAGDALRPFNDIVRAAADGKAAARDIDGYLRGTPPAAPHKFYSLKTLRPQADEIADMARSVPGSAAQIVSSGRLAALTDAEARAEAERCLRCDCGKIGTCNLRKYSEMYGADGSRYRGQRRRYGRRLDHPDIIFEPGKCILCGLCIQIARRDGEPLGLTFVGRGFETRVDAPFDEALAKALTVAARRCVEICPTGALMWRSESACGAGPCGQASESACGACGAVLPSPPPR